MRASRCVPKAIWRDLARTGLLRLGETKGYPDAASWLAAGLEGLAHSLLEGGVATSIISHAALCLASIEAFGSEHAKRAYLEPLRCGQIIGAFCVTEPQGGSVVNQFGSTYRRLPHRDISLDGAKWHVTNLPVCSVMVVFAEEHTTGEVSAFIVDRKWPGVHLSAPLLAETMRTSAIGSLSLSGVLVPSTHILGHLGAGKEILRRAFLLERVLVPFPQIGAIERVVEDCLDYTRLRKVGGEPIGNYQYVQQRLTDMIIGLTTLRASATTALEGYLAGADVALEASVSKLYAAKTTMQVATNAIQVYGSYGMQRELSLTELLLDGIGASIAGGTEETHRKVIYQQALRRAHRRGPIQGERIKDKNTATELSEDTDVSLKKALEAKG